MKPVFQKSSAFCLALAILAAVCAGCGSAAAKPESAAEKANALFAELLKAAPALPREDAAVLEDLSFGYDENLARFGEHYDYFAASDLNHDGTPELIACTVINKGWVPVSVFRYQESENALQLLKDPLAPGAHATFEHMSTASGAYSLYICKEGHLHSCWGGDTPVGFQEENHAYVLEENGLAEVVCSISNHTGNTADIAVDFGSVLKSNDEEARNSLSGRQ